MTQATGNSQLLVERKPWQFQPGQSPNPSGRPKGEGLAQYIQKHTDQGARLARLYLDVAFVEGAFEGARIPIPIRLEAANWLADRGFGKPVQSIDANVTGTMAVVYAPAISQGALLDSVEAEVRELTDGESAATNEGETDG